MDEGVRARLVNDLRRKFNVSEERAGFLVDSGLTTVRKVYEAPPEAFAKLGTTAPALRHALGEKPL
jgi:hypothetical protein